MSASFDDIPALAARVQRLEEALGFAEHEREQLHEQVLALMAQLREVRRTVATLEQGVAQRFAAMETKDSEAVKDLNGPAQEA